MWGAGFHRTAAEGARRGIAERGLGAELKGRPVLEWARELLRIADAGLADALPPGSTHNRPDGGMFVWGRLPDGWDAAELLDRALTRDVAFVPGFPFFAGPPDRATLRFSFTTHGPAEIAEGVARLRASWAA